MLHSIRQHIWKTHQWPQDWNRSVFIPIPKKGNAKESSKYHKCTHFTCLQSNAQNSPGPASTVRDLPDIQTGFRKGRGTRDQIARSIGSSKKQESSRKTSAIPWSARRSNQSILKEISPEYSLEGLMMKLKLQYFGHLVQKHDSLDKTLMLGKIDGGRRREQQRMRWLDGIINLMDMSLSKLQELGCSDRWQMPLSLFGHWQMLFTSASLWLTLWHPDSPSVRRGAVCSVTRTHGHACPTLRPYGSQPASLLCPWASPGNNTGVGCLALLQGIFLTQNTWE